MVRALGRRRLVHGGPRLLGPRWHDRAKLERIAPDQDGPAPWSDPEPELTLSELIAGDPGPEPGQPGPEFPESPGDASMSRGDDAARLALELGGDAALASNDTVPAAGSDAAEALRVAVAETR